MAEGGRYSGLNDDEGEDTEGFVPLPPMNPLVLVLKMQGDEKFEAKQYKEAADAYTAAMELPLFTFMDTSDISEKLFRKRATCFYKMKKFPEAINDSDRAIELADLMNNKNLLAKSIFIKMNAFESLGDFIPAFPLAVWCKHLRPNCDKTKTFLKDLKENLREDIIKDNSVVDIILRSMLPFAIHNDRDPETRELALECYTELLELLDFMYFALPGVIMRKAECLLNLGRYSEAKESCEHVLRFHRDDTNALELMKKITQCLKEKERKQAKEAKKTTTAKTESSQPATRVTSRSTPDLQPYFFKVESQESLTVKEPEKNTANEKTALNCKGNLVESYLENLPTTVHSNDPVIVESQESLTVKEPVENTGNENTGLNYKDHLGEAEIDNRSKVVYPNDSVIIKSSVSSPIDNIGKKKTEDDAILKCETKKESLQTKEERAAPVVQNVQQTIEDLAHTEGEDVAAIDHEKEKKRKKNRKKKIRKKEKKKAQQKKDDSSDQEPTRNVHNTPPDESPEDDVDSQATDSVIGDQDMGFGCSEFANTVADEKTSFGILPLTSSTLEANHDVGTDDRAFLPVLPRRPFNSPPNVQNQFEETGSGLDWIGVPNDSLKTWNHDASTKPKSESVDDLSHSRAKQTPFSTAPTIVDKPLQTGQIRASQMTSTRTKLPQPQEISPFVASGMQSNVGQSKAQIPHTLRPEEFSNLVGGPVQVPTHSSTSTSGIVPGSFKAINASVIIDPSVPTSNRFEIDQKLMTSRHEKSQSFQSTTPVRKPNVDKSSGLTNANAIPEGVFVVCDHFVQNIIPSKTCAFCEQRGMLKYAIWNSNRCYWQVMRPYPAYRLPPRAVFDVCRHFATDRPCPKEPCTFPHGKQETMLWTLEREGRLPTPNESLQISRSSTTASSATVQSAVQDNDTGMAFKMTGARTRNDDRAVVAPFGGFTVDEFPDLRAVSSQNSKPDDSKLSSSTVWSTPREASGRRLAAAPPSMKPPTSNSNSQVDCLDVVSSQILTADYSRSTPSAWPPTAEPPSGRPSTPVPPRPTSEMISSQVAGNITAPPLNFNAESFANTTSSAWSTRLPVRPSTPVHLQAVGVGALTQSSSKDGFANTPPWPTRLELPGRPSTPVTSLAGPVIMTPEVHGNVAPLIKSSAAPPPGSCNDPRKIPKGVYVVCDDFLLKHRKRAASINEKSKACKGCENRLRLKYAFWSGITKQWEIIRPYPAEVAAKVAFKECAHYSTSKPCLRTPCSFAHGQQELIMWTMEREGILPSPRETLTGFSGSMRAASTEVSFTMQPLVQLRYRPSPPGVSDGSYRLCKSYYTHERCRFGRGCLFAHSTDELNEWKQEYVRKEREKLRKAKEEKEEVYSLEMVSNILKGPAEDLVENLPGVVVTCTPPQLNIKLQDKTDTHKYQWMFNLIFKTNEVGFLQKVLLLHRYHNCYQLSEIRVGCHQETPSYKSYRLCYTAKLKDSWYKSPVENRPSGKIEVSLTVSFESSLYGSFDQTVLFDFGKKPYLVQRLNADVMSEALTQEPIVEKHATTSAKEIWNETSMEVVRFVHGTSEALQAEHLSRTYSLTKQVEIAVDTLNPDVYKTVMHQLLFVEEGFMRNEISRYTLNNTQLHAQWSIFDEMAGMKFAVDGELFGVLKLQEEDALRPDDAAGRLLYRNVSSVWLQLADSASTKVYEAPVEKVESECVILRLSSKMCSDLVLHDTCDAAVNAQFQLNRWPLCQMHAAVDRLTKGQLRLIFPEPRTENVKSEIKIRWQWLLDERLNENQKKVIERIACPEYNAPPLVVFGPFGTGKTFTLFQAVRLLVQVDKSHRILLCTYSNRAADIHVELLHDYLTEKNGVPAARPLRVYQPMRRLETASEIARKYCLIKDDLFVLPSRDDLVEHRVVVTTLSTSQVLLDLQVLHGFFTHILIDEAAQALEPEALTPLFFAGPNTKVVFTGDHMQMSPEVYSPQARSLGLQKSLAERLFDVYDKHKADASNSNSKEDPNVLFLTENYRCHKDILQFPSDNFYGEKLVARGQANQPAHPKYGPLLFFSARGKEIKEHDNSYVNFSEVYEVAKRVEEIANTWPSIWNPKELSEIAVLSSYRYQVQAIRNSLRKKGLTNVKVDTIHNVQGEEFRVLFISTVRTFHTCKPQQDEVGSHQQLYWEFLSDPKLLNTAVTRARCLVAVVGDPVSLCTVGECRSLWRDYIKRCNDKGGLHGTTMDELDKEINASIASIELNPEAQPFVPTLSQTPEKNPKEDVNAETGDKEEEKSLQEKNEAEKDEKAPSSESQSLELSGNKTENDNLDGQNDPRASNSAQDHEENEDEEEADDEIAEVSDFQDNLLEDETIFPRDMDEIILAFVKKCEETLQLDAQRTSMFEDSEFPSLQAAKDIKHRPVEAVQGVPFRGGADIQDLFPEVRVVNGRVEVRLTNIGFYTAPSERAKQIIISAKQQEFLDPSVLLRLLKDEPQKYVVCNLRLSPEKFQVGYAEIEDTKRPDIQIKGRVRQAFDKDKVVVELAEKKGRSKTEDSELQDQGKVVGVLEHIISPHERQFVCSTDYENPALMVPINKTATKLVNLTDKSCKDIPIYQKDQNQRVTKVRMMKREKVLSGKYLFVVKYLQWRRDFSYPLGIVVRTLPRGDDLKSSMEIAYAEHGIRKVFKAETMKYVKDNFPPEWSIPKTERSRPKVVNAITIDPPTSLDLDDALTIEKTSPSTFLVGIHIADVSFFVKPNTPLDDEASLRCTSYYPGGGQDNVPMLPRELSENFCSLLPNEDRLAVSLFATLDEEGQIVAEPIIKRTIVRSCCRLTYAEAQVAIRGFNVSSTTPISDKIVEDIRLLNSLAQKRRNLRLGDSGFDHWQDSGSGECFEAHELVEEMMVLANEEIAKYLSRKSSALAPLRTQLPPKDHKLAEWIEAHGKYARLSLKFSHVFKNEPTETSPLNILHEERTKFKIQRSVWAEICQAAASGDIPRLYQLICNENNHPQVTAAMSHFRRIQTESRYVCEGDQPPENISHYSLGMRCYTHFTSPIRRYFDIAVHRLLLGLQSDTSYAEKVSKDDLAKVCRRSTFMQANARKFDKNCKRVQLANQLQQRSRETRVFIESMDHQSISLHISNQKDDHLGTKQKRMLLSHLNPVALREEEEINDGREKGVILKWKFRKYVAPDAISSTKKVENPVLDGVGAVADIPSNIWLEVLDAVRNKDEEKLPAIITQAEEKLRIISSVHGKEKPTKTTPPHDGRGVPYQHPHHNDEATPSSDETVDHFYEKSTTLRRYDYVSVQLCPHMMRGILQPDIQLFKVNTHLNICIEHRRYPRESFAHTARHQASRERYGTINEYIRAWKPVLAMEAATEAVKENDGFVIEDLNMMWERDLEDDTVSGFFTLPSSYCGSRQLKVYSGDLVCIRVPYCNTSLVSGDETSDKPCPGTSSLDENKRASDFWVAHCIIRKAAYKKEIKTLEVIFELHQMSSNIPEWLTSGDSHRSTLELIHRTLPQRRMYAALCDNLRDSSELVHAICKGEEPSEENFGDEPSSDLSLVQHGFQKLNRYQEIAVKEALSKPFTLIQGPPGTGKTITGVHIANWFAERNKTLKSYKVLEKDTGESECAGAYKAPPQVLYCGPSNKSVDVVTEYLLRIPNLKVLRVYSDQIEQMEFPIPNKLKPPRTTRSEEELKISSDKIRHVSLHHVIRGPDCPFSQELRQYEEGFTQSKAKREMIGQKEVSDYSKLIGQAEKWALQKSGVQIILCTCAASGSPRIKTSCDNIQQCIVDECGMCMEPESLVPITCSRARQVVLIGDHKQLQPVIQDHVAKTLGLNVSMFERHSERARMLELQYRMHNGICEFPSKQFYDGKLQTADAVKSRGPSPVTFWPALVRRKVNLPIVFCHVEGQEESTAITTSESNEESKRNMKEVRKAVHIAKYLVNRCRVRMSDVVILSPYREQRSKITELLKGAYDDIQVTTVTKSQGSEWDYVIISLVRSIKREDIDPEPSLSWLRDHLGFLSDEHQMNVGLTRARRGLCIIGNKHLLGMDPMWKSLLQHYEENHCLVDDTWPWP